MQQTAAENNFSSFCTASHCHYSLHQLLYSDKIILLRNNYLYSDLRLVLRFIPRYNYFTHNYLYSDLRFIPRYNYITQIQF